MTVADPGTGTQFNLWKVFETVAGQAPEAEVLVWGGRRLTYADMAQRARRLASYLAGRGLGLRTDRAELAGHQSGQDHVALALYNSNEYLEGMLGSYRARLAPFNVNYRYVGAELEYLLTDARPGAVIYHAALAPELGPVLERLERPPDVLLQVADQSGHDLLAGAVDYETALGQGDPEGPARDPSPDDLYILYTGGTTGMPKGVLWRQHDIFMAAMGGRRVATWEQLASYEQVAARAAAGSGVRVLLVPPLMHGAAQWTAFYFMIDRATLVLPDDPRHARPDDLWRTIERERVVGMTVVGDSMVRPLLDELDRHPYDTSSLLVLGSGGAPLTPGLRQRLHDRLPALVVTDTGGSSETGIQMQTVVSTEDRAGTFSPGPGTTVLTAGLEAVAEPGHAEPGWLAQSGWVPLGYLDDPDKTAATFPVVGGVRYSVPGDRARLLADGRVELLGRDSVTVNSGGEKIFVEEVEAALADHPAVADVVVTGRPSERWGQEVVAIVALADGRTATADELIEHASARLARYKLPKAVVFVPGVVRSPSGKADYRWAGRQASASSVAP